MAHLLRSALHHLSCLGITALLGLALAVLASPVADASDGDAAAVAADTAPSLLDLSARRLGGPDESLGTYRGQVLLVVNTASRCGHTPQYEGLQDLYSRYRERGFSVLGFPSNDFASQEPGTDAEIGDFCEKNYGVEFPMFSKIRVKGDDAHPVYAYLTTLPEPIGGPVKWNFQKYLVDRQGRVVARFAPGTRPEDPQLVAEIERLLAEQPPAS